MLLDWVTARLSCYAFSVDEIEHLYLLGDRVRRYSPVTGEVSWEVTAWDSVRSDSHQIVYRMSSDALWIQGSPARVCGDGCTVVGSGVSSALDLVGCVQRMAAFLSPAIGIDLTRFFTTECLSKWSVSCVDVTSSIFLPALSDVRVALSYLRGLELMVRLFLRLI